MTQHRALDVVRLPDAIWIHPETVTALQRRDVGHLFGLARKYAGASQLRIATLCHMDQGEISRVVNGRRQITSIDVLIRIADALAMPDNSRVVFGLAPVRAAPGPETVDRRPVSVGLREPLTALLGREHELDVVRAALLEHRLVTLVGAPGVGKTRLAIAAARAACARGEDVAFVSLVDATCPESVLPTIASSLGVGDTGGHTADVLALALGGRNLLLVLDNVEQILPVAPLLGDLLSRVPGLRLLTTSRERLRISGERVQLIQPLCGSWPRPEPTDDENAIEMASGSPAVQLFAARAKTVDADFEISSSNAQQLLDLCRYLDGLPLAIELAAARISTFTPAELLERIAHGMELCSDGNRDLPARQQTLNMAVSWSFALLSAEEQTLLARLSVFAGGALLDTIEHVCATTDVRPGSMATAQMLAALVDKNLVYVYLDGQNRTRYAMLHTIRVFAAEQLDAAQGPELRRRHADYYGGLASRVDQEPHATRAEWISRISEDYPDTVAALTQLVEHGEKSAAGALLCALRRFWMTGRFLADGRRWYETVLAEPSGLSSELIARLQLGLGHVACWQTDLTTARRCAQAGLAAFADLADPVEIANAENLLALVAAATGDYPGARAGFERCLRTWRDLGDERRIGVSLCNLGELARRRGDLDEAAEQLTQALDHLTRAEDAVTAVFCLADLGEVRIWQGRPAEAHPLVQTALERSRQLRERFVEGIGLHNSGRLAGLDGDRPEQWRLFTAALKVRKVIGDREGLAKSLEAFADLLCDDEPRVAARLLGAAESLRDATGRPVAPVCRPVLDGCVARIRRQLGATETAVSWAIGRSTPLNETIAQLLAMPASCLPAEK